MVEIPTLCERGRIDAAAAAVPVVSALVILVLGIVLTIRALPGVV